VVAFRETLMPRTIATIEARMSSSRLPGKVLAKAEGRPMLELMVERVRSSPSLDAVVIATTESNSDMPIVALAERLGVDCFRGSEEDVMRRVLDAAYVHDADVIVELTGDCPLTDPAIIEEVICAFHKANVDYAANDLVRSWPIGMDVEVFTTATLADAESRTNDPEEREHVSPFIYRHPELYSQINVTAPANETRPELRLTLDTPEDLEVMRAVFAALGANPPAFTCQDVIEFLDANPDVSKRNACVPHRYVL
jgi:spore coat polysaccharide biosynthesis protein SpsF